MKQCSKCKEPKKLSEFHKDKTHKDGFKTVCKLCSKKYLDENKEAKSKVKKKYYEKNKEEILKDRKHWRDSHKEEIKQYYENNKTKIIKQKNKYKRERCNSDIEFRILNNLRSRLHDALKGKNKASRTLKLLGCSIEFLKKHLESQFKKDMTWDNHSFRGWHIDHIKPCAKFDLSDSEEQRKCFNFKNLQPLWAEENIKKGCYYEN